MGDWQRWLMHSPLKRDDAGSIPVITHERLRVSMRLWFGMACLVPDPSKELKRFGEDGLGAYLNIIAWACSEEEFRERVKWLATELDCTLMDLENIEPLGEDVENPEDPDELTIGQFHIWTRSGEE
jgi:hypothetical protein